MVKRTNNPRETARRKTEGKLARVGYTPLAAKMLSEVLLVLAESSENHRESVLGHFDLAATQKTPWPIVGKRL